MSELRQKGSSGRRLHPRGLPAILTLIAVVAAGFLLRWTGTINALVDSAMNRPTVRESPPPDYAVSVVDEQGQPVPAFEIVLQAAEGGLTTWERGAAGRVTFSGHLSTEYHELPRIDALVRAEGYACSLAHFAGPDRDRLFGGKATITVRHGQQVDLRFRLPEGMRLPNDFLPDVYYADQREAIRIMWDPENRRAYQGHLPDFNYFNVKRFDGGRFGFRLANGSEPFYVAVHRPGILQCFESGPFTTADISGGVLEINVPKPAALDIVFEPGAKGASLLPFESVILNVLCRDPLASSTTRAMLKDGEAGRQRLTATDLAPGAYRATVQTWKKLTKQRQSPSAADPAFFRDSADVVLSPGETRHIEFRYVPLDTNAFRGDSTARVRVVHPDGSPATGLPVIVTYRDPRYGDLRVFSGRTSRSGEVEVRGITDREPEDPSFEPYRIAVEGHVLASFRLTKGKSAQAFTFPLAPRSGDVVPDIELLNIATGARSKLHSLRGKVICLELWATWCGPCQESMRGLCQLASENRTAWRDRVVIVPLSIDDNPDRALRHVKDRGWDQVDHYWSGAQGATGWEAPAMRALVGQGVPELVIVGRNGRILWRGHPADKSDRKDVKSRVEEAMEK